MTYSPSLSFMMAVLNGSPFGCWRPATSAATRTASTPEAPRRVSVASAARVCHIQTTVSRIERADSVAWPPEYRHFLRRTSRIPCQGDVIPERYVGMAVHRFGAASLLRLSGCHEILHLVVGRLRDNLLADQLIFARV